MRISKEQAKAVIVLAGPTAVGKTAVGVLLGKHLKGEIVSCDSMQVYQDVSIASNRPSPEELAAVRHHMIGIVPLSQKFDAAAFNILARQSIDNIFSRGRIPIIAGGTGMYLKVLLDGIFESPEIPDGVRQGLEEELSRRGGDLLYKELLERDPEAAIKIHPNDSRRIVRALEVCRATGTRISCLQKTIEGLWGQYPVFGFGLDMDRNRLYARIDSRVDQMFEAGLVDEIRALQAKEVSLTAQAIIGVKEVRAYLSGTVTLQEAKQEMKKNTRRLAKRQLTWFRAEKRLHWIHMAEHGTVDSAVETILRILNGGGHAEHGTY